MGCAGSKRSLRGACSPVFDRPVQQQQQQPPQQPSSRRPAPAFFRENLSASTKSAFGTSCFEPKYVVKEDNYRKDGSLRRYNSCVKGNDHLGVVVVEECDDRYQDQGGGGGEIGQGTYSTVYQAREVETGKMVALKKVRFDTYQPESIRFMAREILILRRLDHPNIMKLEGIITSRISTSLYLVFEYMEHDLAGLITSPEINFSEAQVKCYMKQLLCAIEHCHVNGIMHRDIKSSNILVNNEGILKLADFGLANVLSSRNKQQLTSRVVTLWYRAPELLMGSTSYGVSADLWSIGCVLAEILTGKPFIKGRTEVEQLHKIFKLCGSPPDEFWKQSKLPNAIMFRPQHSYESSLRERCKDFPSTAVDLIETLLSIEPEKRGTASSALICQYFSTKPYPCDPSSLPKYPPNKEMDAKYREEARRKKAGVRSRDPRGSKKPRRPNKTLQEQIGFWNRIDVKEEAKDNQQLQKANGSDARPNKTSRLVNRQQSFDGVSLPSQATNGRSSFKGPAPVTASSGFAWVKRQREDCPPTIKEEEEGPFVKSYAPSITSTQLTADSSRFQFVNNSFDPKKEERQRHKASGTNSLDATGGEAVAAETNMGKRNAKLSRSETTTEALLQRNGSQKCQAAQNSKLDKEMLCKVLLE
ncbi:hypothetical protein Tsubulata_004046 [Turnera subulata]|uniref:Protein kinase domain-containing protein n=1 Tax=Turnera subulata TaxID=218843 RepID=A0A9Q0F8R5_9ROSI|nr:hypothetical protein Tsubulata_004046 [Turnera subulata]